MIAYLFIYFNTIKTLQRNGQFKLKLLVRQVKEDNKGKRKT